MPIHLAGSRAELDRCFPIVAQLRPSLTADAFAAAVERQAREGYVLAFLEERGRVLAVAGYRLCEMLGRGPHMYIDDLVTDAAHQGEGWGKQLFTWLVEQAQSHGCRSIELDSGVQRHDAHAFYFARGMYISSYHFRLPDL